MNLFLDITTAPNFNGFYIAEKIFNKFRNFIFEI